MMFEQAACQKVFKKMALLGQPNSGKSTLFNALTGSKQHVGNWPGKTVEQKTGTFSFNGTLFSVVDLPGSYSLNACSKEESVTAEYITSGEADLVCIIVDASQLERSMFILADYAGINCPAILILSMIDIASEMGRRINTDAISKELAIPVVAMNTSDKNDYDGLFRALAQEPRVPDCSALYRLYETEIGDMFCDIVRMVPEEKKVLYSGRWAAARIIEKDDLVLHALKEAVSPPDRKRINNLISVVENGPQKTGKCKFEWIKELLKENVSSAGHEAPVMGSFDRLATSRRWGKSLAVVMMFAGLIASFIITIPWMYLSFKAPRVLLPSILDGLGSAGMSPWFLSLVEVAMQAVGTAIGLAGFVAGSSLVFGFMEEVGYMARIAYVFDNTMSRLGLQGKSVMPFLMSFGCAIGGSTSTRVIDTWGQRVLTMALAWMMPCAATWGVVAVFGAAFFGLHTVWVIAALFISAYILLYITARIFGPRLVKDDEQAGLIMELPPYHKPRWGNLFRFVFIRMGDMLKRALAFIVSISVLFWVFAYTADGNIEHSILYRIGRSVEPLTMWFGLTWQTFTALICSIMGKEAALGVLSSVFGASATVVGSAEVSADLGSQLRTTLSTAEALAFLFGFFFNVPCFVAVLSMKHESHSWSWTLRIAGYYMALALFMSALVYHISRFILE